MRLSIEGRARLIPQFHHPLMRTALEHWMRRRVVEQGRNASSTRTEFGLTRCNSACDGFSDG